MKFATSAVERIAPTPVNVRRNFEAASRGMYVKGLAVERLIADWPAGEPHVASSEFTAALELVMHELKTFGRFAQVR